MKKFKSIRAKIAVSMSITILAALLAVEAANVWLNYRSSVSTIQQMMKESAVLAADVVGEEIMSFRNVASDTGYIPQLSDPDVPLREKRAIIDQRVALNNFTSANIVDVNGIGIFDGTDFSDQAHVREALRGNVTVSDPLVSKLTGKISVIIAAPLWRDGVANSTVVGAITYVPPETFLNDIVSGVLVSEHSHAYMINKNGYTIADNTMDTIMTENVENDAARDKSLSKLAEIHSAMRSGRTGFDSYSTGGTSQFIAYAPVSGTDGWSLGVTAPQMDYLKDTYTAIACTMVLVAVFFVIAWIIAAKLARDIGLPMKACAQRMELLVQGDLHSPVPKVDSEDETGVLAQATSELVTCLQVIIGDIGQLLKEMSNQNLNIHSQHESTYVGDFSNILFSMRHLRLSLSSTLMKIDKAAELVSGGSNQVANGAQALGQGSVEQASSVEELAATINDLTAQVKETAGLAETARSHTSSASDEADHCTQQMNELVRAMEDIRKSSTEISKIIQTIEDIAFQTNILALNAAVEAARAGSAGKGFTVVADEVRNLAGKSAQAAQSTADLIAGSREAVNRGMDISNNTAATLMSMVAAMQSVVDSIDQIATAAVGQSDHIDQVSAGIEQISCVVQNNSATAEESAAASEELSAEAYSLKQLVGQFSLAEDI